MRRVSLFDLFGIASLIVGTLFFVFFVLILPRSWTGSDYEALMGLPDSAPTLITTSDLPVLGPPEQPATETPTPDMRPIRPEADYNDNEHEIVILTVINESGVDICKLYMVESNDDTGGLDLLRFETPVTAGETRRFEVRAGAYTLRAVDCSDTAIAITPRTIWDDTEWRITDR